MDKIVKLQLSETFELLSRQDLYNLTLEELNKLINQQESRSNTWKNIKFLINEFFKLINLFQQQALLDKRNNNDETLVESNNIEYRNTMVFGARLVYLIRTFILGETIDYSLGGRDVEGNLLQKEVAQNEILSQLTASLSRSAILLKEEMEKFSDGDRVTHHLNDLWKQVEILANPNGINSKHGQLDHNIKKPQFWTKVTADTNVAIRYAGSNPIKKYSYYKKYQRYNFYNYGWLYEWFNEIIGRQGGYRELRNSVIRQKSVYPMMKKMDNIPGYKGGDYQIGKKQIQAKFGNLKIISFYSIKKVLSQLQEAINLYEGNEINKEVFITKLIKLFTDRNEKQINKSLIKTINNRIFDNY